MKQRLNPLVCAIAAALLTVGCETTSSSESGAFQNDVDFMQQHTPIVLLKDGDSAVAVAPDYQGRVMTSTYDLKSGPSFGWINRPVIEQGILSKEQAKGKLEQHIHIFGGEERFWLGPEGGQYALFFQPGDEFVFSDWKTPAAIDTEPFKLVAKSKKSARFKHEAELVNHTGSKFKMGIERTITLLDSDEISKLLGVEIPAELQMVAYKTDNRITNIGKNAWLPETGLPSIWILGMYNPSPKTTVVIPFKAGSVQALGPKVNDSYFGKVPPEFLRVDDDRLFLKGDGTLRSKIGITAQRSKGIAGSYDAAGQVLNIVTYNVQKAPHGYVNSMWELQPEPYSGDVINAYNDGPPEPGAAPLGPFYELETSSPAAALQPDESMRHIQWTLHIQGPETKLAPLARKLLGTDLAVIKSTFSNTR
jgi:hypothetical protein